MWLALIRYIIPQNFLLGIGFGLENVRVAVAPYVFYSKHAHNMYLAILAETGLIGACLFFPFIFAFIKKLWGYRKREYVQVFLLMIITCMINGIGEEIINHRFFWILFGFGYLAINYYNQKGQVANKEG